MIVKDCLQLSPEWWALKVGKISGTRFGQLISTRKNKLIYEVMNELLDEKCIQDDFISEDMQYGLDNEVTALKLYEEQEGIKTYVAGAIVSETSSIHMASPDAIADITDGYSIVQEVKCTMHGDIHIKRIFEGVDSTYIPQCINYFAVAPEIKEVHFISYCGFRTERPLHVIKLQRADFQKEIEKGLLKLAEFEANLKIMMDKYYF